MIKDIRYHPNRDHRYTTDEEYPSFINLQEDIEYMDYTIISEYAEKKDLEGLSYDDTQKDYIDTTLSYELMPLYDSGSCCFILIDLREQYFGRLINMVPICLLLITKHR